MNECMINAIKDYTGDKCSDDLKESAQRAISAMRNNRDQIKGAIDWHDLDYDIYFVCSDDSTRIELVVRGVYSEGNYKHSRLVSPSVFLATYLLQQENWWFYFLVKCIPE